MNQPKRACYCINLRRAANAVSAAYDVHLAPLGITVNQYSILRGLERIEPCSVSDLADHLSLNRTSLVRMLKPITALGLIADQAEKGRRSHQLCLSAAGQKTVQAGVSLWLAAQAEVEQCIGKEETDHLMSILARLETSLKPPSFMQQA